jgi:hypothetical protein
MGRKRTFQDQYASRRNRATLRNRSNDFLAEFSNVGVSGPVGPGLPLSRPFRRIRCMGWNLHGMPCSDRCNRPMISRDRRILSIPEPLPAQTPITGWRSVRQLEGFGPNNEGVGRINCEASGSAHHAGVERIPAGLRPNRPMRFGSTGIVLTAPVVVSIA